MTARELLSKLSTEGVNLEATKNGLRIDAPKGALTSDLRQVIAEQKTEILALLRQRNIKGPTQPNTIKAAPGIKEVGEQEKELDTLIDQLRKRNRHWKIQEAKRRGVPMKALIHAANLWLSDDPDDWTAANDTIFQFTSQFGNKQLCYRRSKKVAIPQIGG